MKKNTKQHLKTLLIGVAIISALFAFAIVLILVSDYYRFKRAAPLTSPALQELRERLHQNPEDNQLREEIRELDFIARKAHFVSESKREKGIIYVVIALTVLLISIHIIIVMMKDIKTPEKCNSSDNPLQSASKARIYIISSILWIFAIIFAITYLKPRKASTLVVQSSTEQFPTDEEFKKNWPEFRGNNGSSILYSGAPPLHWDGKTGKGIEWKTEIPLHGYSSPIIWENKIFLTGGNKKVRKVFCFSKKTGQLLWEAEVPFMAPPGSKIPSVTEDTGFAAPTMTTDGSRVFAIFATGDIVALSMTGEQLWQLNLGVPDNHYAYSSSLLFCDGKIIVQYDDSTRTKLIALNPKDGSTIWKNNRKASISWASPVAINVPLPEKNKKVPLIIIATSSIVSAHSPKTGKTVWSTECMAGEVAPSPAYHNGIIFVANEFASAVALDALSGKILWQKDELDLPDVATPLATDNKVYLAASSGILSCLNSKTGDEIWVQEYEDGFYSSPILVGDLIYLLNMKGEMIIIKDSKKYEEISKAYLNGIGVTTPAFTGKHIYIRMGKYLYSISD